MVASVAVTRNSSGTPSEFNDLSAGYVELASVDQELMKLINLTMNMLQHRSIEQNPANDAASGISAMSGRPCSYIPTDEMPRASATTTPYVGSTAAPAHGDENSDWPENLDLAPQTTGSNKVDDDTSPSDDDGPWDNTTITPQTTSSSGLVDNTPLTANDDSEDNSDTVTPATTANEFRGDVQISPSNASWGGLSAAPQLTSLSESEGHTVAEQYIANLQKDFGLTRDQAAGIVANLWHESAGMNSGINQGGAIGEPSDNMADDNGNGYGIAQWGGSRKQGLENFANANKLDDSSEAADYGFLKQELQTNHADAIAAVKSTNTAAAATEAFSSSFEKPSDPQMSSRLQDLQEV